MESRVAIGADIVKSTRHSQITGIFAGALVLYWLSRDAFECARIGHTGIDHLARNRHTKELMGISVKSRSRFRGTEVESVSVPTDNFRKVKKACAAFGCQPYFAIVVDGGGWLRMFLTSMAHFSKVSKRGQERVHWGMTGKHLQRYRLNHEIKSVELQISAARWWGTPDNIAVQLTPASERG